MKPSTQQDSPASRYPLVDQWYKEYIETKKEKPSAQSLIFFAKQKGTRLVYCNVSCYLQDVAASGCSINSNHKHSVNTGKSIQDRIKNMKQNNNNSNCNADSGSNTVTKNTEIDQICKLSKMKEKMENVKSDNKSSNNNNKNYQKWNAKSIKSGNYKSIKERRSSISSLTDLSNNSSHYKQTRNEELSRLSKISSIKDKIGSIANNNNNNNNNVKRDFENNWNSRMMGGSVKERANSIGNVLTGRGRSETENSIECDDCDNGNNRTSELEQSSVKDRIGSIGSATILTMINGSNTGNGNLKRSSVKERANSIACSQSEKHEDCHDSNRKAELAQLSKISSIKDKMNNIASNKENDTKRKRSGNEDELKRISQLSSIKDKINNIRDHTGNNNGNNNDQVTKTWNVNEEFANSNVKISIKDRANSIGHRLENNENSIKNDRKAELNQLSQMSSIKMRRQSITESHLNVSSKTWNVENDLKNLIRERKNIKDRLSKFTNSNNNDDSNHNSKTKEIAKDLEMLTSLSVKDKVNNMKHNNNNNNENGSKSSGKTWDIANDFKNFLAQRQSITERIENMNNNNEEDSKNDKESTQSELKDIVRRISIKDRINQLKSFEEEREAAKREEHENQLNADYSSFTSADVSLASAVLDSDTNIKRIAKQFNDLNSLLPIGCNELEGETSNSNNKNKKWAMKRVCHDHDQADGKCKDSENNSGEHEDDEKANKLQHITTGAKLVASILDSKHVNVDKIEKLDFEIVDTNNENIISNLVKNEKIIINKCIAKRNAQSGIITLITNVTNNNNENSTKIHIPNGMVFEPSDKNVQPMIIANQRKNDFELSANERKNIKLISYCGNTSKHWPSSNGDEMNVTFLKWKLPQNVPTIEIDSENINEMADTSDDDGFIDDDDDDDDDDGNAKQKMLADNGTIQSCIWSKFRDLVSQCNQ